LDIELIQKKQLILEFGLYKNYISDFDELVAKTKKIDKTNNSWERQIYRKLAQRIKNRKESE